MRKTHRGVVHSHGYIYSVCDIFRHRNPGVKEGGPTRVDVHTRVAGRGFSLTVPKLSVPEKPVSPPTHLLSRFECIRFLPQ